MNYKQWVDQTKRTDNREWNRSSFKNDITFLSIRSIDYIWSGNTLNKQAKVTFSIHPNKISISYLEIESFWQIELNLYSK